MSKSETMSSSSITKFIAAVVVSVFITAPASLTFVASVTSALVSIVSNLVPSTDTSLPSTLPAVTIPANVGVSVVATPWFKAFTAASSVNSLSITAPAAVTLVVSVTSALSSKFNKV